MTLLLLLACDPDPTPPDEAECTPFQDGYAASLTVIDNACGDCHGSTPEFGAPYSLVEGYEDLIAGEEGERKVDAMLASLLDGSMPPSNADALTHTELETLVAWTSCGLEHAPTDEGLTVNRDVWEAPEDPPEGATILELTAVEEEIGLDDIDDYRGFTFSGVVDETAWIQRIEPIIDESRVLHHITFTYEGGFPFLYAWAPGTNAIEFPDGGMKVDSGDRFELEIHYNNGAGISDAVDSSGVRLYLTDSVDIEYGMMSPNTWDMVIPAGQEASFSQTCTAQMDFEILAGMPHMHETGSTFVHDVTRTDGSIDNLITLSGWAFESQYFYEMPMEVNAGDTLTMTCGYYNPGPNTVTAGLATSDEMCFDFLVVTPANAAYQCLGF